MVKIYDGRTAVHREGQVWFISKRQQQLDIG